MAQSDRQDSQGTVRFYAACALLAASAILLRLISLPILTHDMTDDLLSWFDYIVRHGKVGAISDKFYNYTPPYIYLMVGVSYLDGIVSRVTLIKSIPIVFDVISAYVVFRLASVAQLNVRRSVLLALLYLNLPTLILDGAAWGQFDVVYTTFMLAFIYFMVVERPYWAVAMYAIAFSIKLQAIFLAPIFGYFLLAGLMPFAAILLIPAIYTLLMLPAALAGRSWIDLFITLYTDQVNIPNRLSARAPNIYVTIQHFLSPQYYPQAVLAGTAVAILITLIVLATHFRVRRPPPAVFIIAASTLWVALEPSILPKMHERYFISADLFAFVLAIYVPRAWWTVVLLQIGSILSYSYFMMIGHDLPFDLHPAAQIGSFAEIPAVLGIAFYYWRSMGGLEGRRPALTNWARPRLL